MEEFIRQFEAFLRSLWGGLIGLACILVIAWSVLHDSIKGQLNLRLAIGELGLGIPIIGSLLASGHTTLGIIAAAAETLALSILIVRARTRRHEEKVPPASLSREWWIQVVILGAVMAALVWVIPWVAGYPTIAFFFLGVGLISYLLFLSIIVWKQRRSR
jgi:hypothetical protein